jgi:hypothetical protein
MGIIMMISIQLFPKFLDTGIQIWNGITMSQMPAFVKNREWNFDALELLHYNFNLIDKITRGIAYFNENEMYEGECNKLEHYGGRLIRWKMV